MRFPAIFRPLLAGLALLGTLGTSITASAADIGSIAALGDTECKDEVDFMCVDNAFRVSATATAPDRIEVTFQVAHGYYLYRDKLKFKTDEGQPAALGAPGLPEGDKKNDEFFGEQVVYHKDFVAKVPVSRSRTEAFTLPIKVSYQGCAEAGLCYPPQTKVFQIAMPEATGVATLAAGSGSATEGGHVSEEDKLANLIRSGNILLMISAFFGAGLLLAFTPCVLPMVPIVAGLITAGGASVTRARAFSLSLAYVLGMAATYTAAGVAFAAAGQQAQTLFQQAWIILLFAGLFVAMSISMFGFYTVQMPSFIQTRLTEMSNQQKGGSYIGVAVMGALSALIVTTCVGPALVAALSVIGQSGQMFRGGVALFAMAMGMGVPLLIVGASAGQLLPRAGAWMDVVKQVFGALMLGVAVWMLSRILPERWTMLAWMVPLIALAIVLGRAPLKSSGSRLAVRALGSMAMIYAIFLAIGFYKGNTDPLHPLQAAAAHVELPFQRIKSLDDLNAEVAKAKAAGKSVMLDFYADWCISCKEMERDTFPKAEVRAALSNTVWLQADVTANDETDQALMKHFGIFGPPSIRFFGTDGVERSEFKHAGYLEARKFAPLVTEALK